MIIIIIITIIILIFTCRRCTPRSQTLRHFPRHRLLPCCSRWCSRQSSCCTPSTPAPGPGLRSLSPSAICCTHSTERRFPGGRKVIFTSSQLKSQLIHCAMQYVLLRFFVYQFFYRPGPSCTAARSVAADGSSGRCSSPSPGSPCWHTLCRSSPEEKHDKSFVDVQNQSWIYEPKSTESNKTGQKHSKLKPVKH